MLIRDAVLDLEVGLAADGSQIELRFLAELSKDPLLIRQFQEASSDRHNPLKDVHCQVGHMLTGFPVERIAQDKKTRRVVKNLHFGIVYGLAEAGVYPYVVAKIRAVDGPNADLTGITPERMVQLHRKYFKVYKGVKIFMELMRAMGEDKGYVSTLFGFNREIRQDDEDRGTYWGNQAINTPVQGSAHQYILMCMALIEMRKQAYSRLQKCIMEVHDALFFFVKLRHLAEAYRQFTQLFEVDAREYARKAFGINLQVPMLAEAQAGFTFGSMIDYAGEPLDVFLPAWRTKLRAVESKSWEDLMPQTL